MKKFTIGMVTGMSSLALAVPLMAQMAGAQTPTESVDVSTVVPTQACVSAMANLEEAHLGQFDLMNEQRKQGIQTRITALVNAAAISDDAARKEALDAMRESMKSQRGSMKDSISEEVQTAMNAVKEACGDTFKMRFEGFKGEHPVMGKFFEAMPGKIADKLGMTEDELKAALDAGNTIQEIAEEKGIELPAPGHRLRMMHFEDEIEQ